MQLVGVSESVVPNLQEHARDSGLLQHGGDGAVRVAVAGRPPQEKVTQPAALRLLQGLRTAPPALWLRRQTAHQLQNRTHALAGENCTQFLSSLNLILFEFS